MARPDSSPSSGQHQDTRTFRHGRVPPTLCQTPNQFAPKADLRWLNGEAIFHGYQHFRLSKTQIEILSDKGYLREKQRLLERVLFPQRIRGRTLVDLGTNNGMFAFWASLQGAGHVVGVDLDEEYLDIAEEARSRLSFDKVRFVRKKVEQWTQQADIVLAMALIHWVYSCTATMGSLDAIMRWLAGITKDLLIVEWIDPDDAAMRQFGHVEWNRNHTNAPYTADEFRRALDTHFERAFYIGSLRPGRHLYGAWKHENECNSANPLPLLYPEETIVSSRFLTEHNGTEYWTRVHHIGGRAIKQATGDTAAREHRFLQRLSGSAFPATYGAKLENVYSVAEFEWIDGDPLPAAAKELRQNERSLIDFASRCVGILRALADAGITHRDIREANILVRDGHPVLFDFGWAVSRDDSIFEPFNLNKRGRAPEGDRSDVYAMGRVLRDLTADVEPDLHRLFSLVTLEDPTIRLREIDTITWFLDGLGGSSARKASADATAKALNHWALLVKKSEKISADYERLARRVKSLEARLYDIEESLTWRLMKNLGPIADRATPPDSTRRRVLGRVVRKLVGR